MEFEDYEWKKRVREMKKQFFIVLMFLALFPSTTRAKIIRTIKKYFFISRILFLCGWIIYPLFHILSLNLFAIAFISG